MNNKLTRILAGVLSILCVGQTAMTVVSSSEKTTAAESFATPVTDQNEIVYANDLTIHGYVQKGTVDGFTARDNEPAYVRIFNGDWAEIAYTEVNSDGSYSVTASGSEVYHVKYECNGYLPFYLKDFGTGSYQVGSGGSDNIVTLVPGDTTYNADNDNQWSDDVLNSSDVTYVQECVGETSYVATDFNLSMDLNDDGQITQEELDEFCAFYTDLSEGEFYDLADESADIDYFDVNDDGIINRYDYYLMYDLVYNERSPEIVNIPDLTGDGIFDINDLQPFWNRISTANDPDKWIWVYNHDMNRDGIVNIDDYITEKLDYYGNPPFPSEKYQSYMDKNGNGCIDSSDVAWFQAAYDLYGDLDWDHAFKKTLTLNANGKFNWSLNLHDTDLNLNGYALYVGDSMSFTTDIPSFWSNGEGAELNICGGRLETGNNLVFRTASPDGWDGTTGQNMYLNGGSVVIGGDFNFGQANCYDTIWMTNENDYLEINHNWNYITLTDMEGKWTAGMINFQGPTWEVNEASGEKSVYSSGTHSIRFYYPDGKQTILWDNPNEYINAEDGTPNTLRTFNFNYIDPTTGECLGLIFPNGYSEELYWFRPWFKVEETVDWLPLEQWDNYPDTDGDGLPDKVEMYIGTDPTKKDTDGDGLTDYDELFKTFTDPTLYDTDSNGINDGQEDFDDDNLNNIEEIENGTDCYDEDTDVDGLTDGDEVKIYHSDPLNADTDGDTLTDGDDVALGFDPTLPDTDFNGILDCNEKIRQTLTLNVDDDTNPIESVTVSFKGTGNINKNTSITDIMGKDVLCSNIVGLVGNPYDINSTSQFDEAELSFKIRKNCLGETAFDDLAILWYNEDEQTFELIDCTLDSANSVVKATLPHFSKYMIVNRKEWAEAWATSLDYSKYDSYDIVYAIDCSGSMEDLDPEPNESGTASKRHMAANNLIGVMEENDEAAVIGFNYTTSLLCDFTSDQSNLKSALYNLYQEGSTNFNPVLSESISKLTAHTETSEETVGKMIILISDGGMLDDLDEPLNEDLLTDAKEADIKIYTIGVGAEVDEEILHKIAEATDGEYYYASTNDEISDLYNEIGVARAKEIDMTDFDEDGLPDIFEIVGMQLQDGTVIRTDPSKSDTDGDGLLDGEEITIYYDESTGTVTFTKNSDPNLVDADGDGLWDNCDPKPNDQYNKGYYLTLTSGDNGTLAQLQHWLVELGYLNMDNNPYGENYGPITRTAIYIYQMNHGLQSTTMINGKETAIENIDDLTYATIANDYSNNFGNGEDDYLNYVDGISTKPYFNSIEITSPKLSEAQSACGVKVIKKDNSTIKDDSASTFYLYFYDYTELINSKMNDNILYLLHFAYLWGDIESDPSIADMVMIEFFDKVRPKGDWDYKLKTSWEKEFDDIPYMTISFPFILRGDFCSAEKFGNVNYGYVGKAIGFSEEILIAGGHAVSVITSHQLEDEDDINNVKKGFEYFDSDINEK